MKAIEFESKLTSDARLDVPEAVAEKIPKEATVRVIVLMPEDAEDQAWRHLTEIEFLKDVDELDRAYDAL
jgi:hypothetical protein